MFALMKRLWREEEGAGLVEYALLVVLIALVAAAGLIILGNGLLNLFTGIGTEVDSATVPDIP